STNDFVDNYTYAGPAGQMSEVTQQSNGGNAVAPKAGTFAYDYLGEFTTVDRYNTAGTSQLVAQAAYGYLCPCQLAGMDFPAVSVVRPRLGVVDVESRLAGTTEK